MNPKDLVKVWDAPDHSRLTPKQISIRLPIVVAAKISALCELYPRTSKSQMIGDLLATALDQVEESLPSKRGRLIRVEPDFPPEGVGQDYVSSDTSIYEDVGPKGKFRMFTEKHLRELEKEAGIKDRLEIAKPLIFEDEDKN